MRLRVPELLRRLTIEIEQKMHGIGKSSNPPFAHSAMVSGLRTCIFPVKTGITGGPIWREFRLNAAPTGSAFDIEVAALARGAARSRRTADRGEAETMAAASRPP